MLGYDGKLKSLYKLKSFCWSSAQPYLPSAIRTFMVSPLIQTDRLWARQVGISHELFVTRATACYLWRSLRARSPVEFVKGTDQQ
jgi:hypothetical protein